MLPGRGGLPRRLKSLNRSLLPLCAVLAGCANLEFVELVRAPPPSGYRATFGERGEVSAMYRLQADDVLVLQVKKPQSAPISSVKDGNGEQWLKSPASRFAVRVGELQGRTISVSASGEMRPAFSAALLEKPDEQDEGQKRLVLIGRSWGDVKAGTDERLAIELEPRSSPDSIAAGDVVEMTRRYTLRFAMQGDGPGFEPFLVPRVESFRLSVDARGYVSFPALTVASDLTGVDAESDSSADFRALRARLAAVQDVLRVANPARPVAEQTSLQTLAACLSEGAYFRFPDVDGQSDQANRRCWEAGVSRQFGTPPQLDAVRGLVYSLSVVPRSWWLVDEQGNRFEIVLRHSDTIPDAVLRERQRLTGRRLFSTFSNHAYLVVVPRKTIASEVEPPFYLRVGKGAQAESYRVMPGDTVYVTYLTPKRAIGEEGAR